MHCFILEPFIYIIHRFAFWVTISPYCFMTLDEFINKERMLLQLNFTISGSLEEYSFIFHTQQMAIFIRLVKFLFIFSFEKLLAAYFYRHLPYRYCLLPFFIILLGNLFQIDMHVFSGVMVKFKGSFWVIISTLPHLD